MAFEVWAGKTVVGSEISGLFCGSLEEKNAEENVDYRDLAREVSEVSENIMGAV